MNFMNNVNSIENWAKAKNHHSHKILGKRSDTNRTKNILQLKIARIGTLLDKIVQTRQQIANKLIEFQDLINIYSSKFSNFFDKLHKHYEI